jgi:membrane protease YdiL (CAAX protease family)
MKITTTDAIYFLLPLILWPVSFILLQSTFIYALTVSTAMLALFSVYKYKISWIRTKNWHYAILAGLAAAFVLYLLFVLGNVFSNALGLGKFVNSVYASIYETQGNGAVTVFLLAIIGIFEEIYWRGGFQGYVESKSKIFKKIPWVASSCYYAFVHISTLNPILVIAALVVGVVTSIVAYKFGILASVVTHILWIESIVVLFPV